MTTNFTLSRVIWGLMMKDLGLYSASRIIWVCLIRKNDDSVPVKVMSFFFPLIILQGIFQAEADWCCWGLILKSHVRTANPHLTRGLWSVYLPLEKPKNIYLDTITPRNWPGLTLTRSEALQRACLQSEIKALIVLLCFCSASNYHCPSLAEGKGDSGTLGRWPWAAKRQR